MLEYLKGTGGATVSALAYGENMYGTHFADTPEEAKENSWMLGEHRDTRWDDRQAVVFLEQPVAGGPYLLGRIGWRSTDRDVEVTNTVTVSDDERQSWLPATNPPGAQRSGETTEQRFFLEDPGATTTATAVSAPRGAARSPSSTTPTISKSSLKAKIAELESGITSDAYRQCIYINHRAVRYVRYNYARDGFSGHTDKHSLRSGSPADTEVAHAWEVYSRSFDAIRVEWVVGPDKDLFTARGGYLYANRPLPQGEYQIFYNWKSVEEADCPPYPKEYLEYHGILVTVTAPPGTLAESFFNP